MTSLVAYTLPLLVTAVVMQTKLNLLLLLLLLCCWYWCCWQYQGQHAASVESGSGRNALLS
jgi:hypothetical protein